jgi:primosomal protein N''
MSNEKKIHTAYVRQSVEQAGELDLISRAENVSKNDLMNEAIAELIQKRRNDPEFLRRVKEMVERDKMILERLTDEKNEK